MKLTLGEVKMIFINLLTGKISREEADRWAYSTIQKDESDELEYIPPENKEMIWDGLMYLYGVDIRKSPSEYLHSDSDISLAYKQIFSEDPFKTS